MTIARKQSRFFTALAALLVAALCIGLFGYLLSPAPGVEGTGATATDLRGPGAANPDAPRLIPIAAQAF
jgi:hypothetical protein